jgi:hypothetical protein
VSGHASHEERLEIMREAYRKVFGAEMPEPEADGAITLLSFTRGGAEVTVSIQVIGVGDAPGPPPDAPDLWLGSDL